MTFSSSGTQTITGNGEVVFYFRIWFRFILNDILPYLHIFLISNMFLMLSKHRKHENFTAHGEKTWWVLHLFIDFGESCFILCQHILSFSLQTFPLGSFFSVLSLILTPSHHVICLQLLKWHFPTLTHNLQVCLFLVRAIFQNTNKICATWAKWTAQVEKDDTLQVNRGRM